MNSSSRGRGAAALVGGLSLALVLAACSPPPEEGGGGQTNGDGGTAEEGCEAFEQYGDLSGTTVSVYTAIMDQEGDAHEASYDEFTRCTGVTIAYEGSSEFEEQLPVRVQAGSAPDIAFIPQPGLLQTLVQDNPGAIVEVTGDALANLDEYYAEDWKAYGTVDGTLYGVPMGASVKSFVWYSPTMFADAGYEIPTTWEEMIALSDEIVAAGGAQPWCVGIEDGPGTGWVATDWLEDVMIRTAGPDVYDQWVTNEIPFDDPAVLEALQTAGQILKNPDYVNASFGGVPTIATTAMAEAGYPILDGNCWMHRQASFYANFWEQYQEGVEIGEDGDVFAFYLPDLEGSDDQPIIGGGDFVAAFAERPEVQAFQAFLLTPEWVNARIEAGPGFVSANSGQDTSLYTSPIDQLSAELLADTDRTFRFDGSDLMPGAVGAGSFWREMVNWIAQDKADEEVLADIQSSWP